MNIKCGDVLILDNRKKYSVLEDGHSDTPFPFFLFSLDTLRSIEYVDDLEDVRALIEDELLLGKVVEIQPDFFKRSFK